MDISEGIEYAGPEGRRYVLAETFQRVRTERDALRAELDAARASASPAREKYIGPLWTGHDPEG